MVFVIVLRNTEFFQLSPSSILLKTVSIVRSINWIFWFAFDRHISTYLIAFLEFTLTLRFNTLLTLVFAILDTQTAQCIINLFKTINRIFIVVRFVDLLLLHILLILFLKCLISTIFKDKNLLRNRLKFQISILSLDLQLLLQQLACLLICLRLFL